MVLVHFLVQYLNKIAKPKVKKGDGFVGFGKPDPFNQNDDDQVDAGETNAIGNYWDYSFENHWDFVPHESDDDSFVQVASKKAAKKGDGFDIFGKPVNQNDDDQVDAGEPNRRTCRSLNGCGDIFCYLCYPD